MKLAESGRVIVIEGLEVDAFERPGQRAPIETDAKARFPGVDLIIYEVKGGAKSMVSFSGSLDPLTMGQTLIRIGIFCMGSNRKVTLMTQSQLSEAVAHILPFLGGKAET